MKPEASGTSVPKLRFPEFRDAGEWEKKQLGRISDVREDMQGPESNEIVSGEHCMENTKKDYAASVLARLIKNPTCHILNVYSSVRR